ncbi:hypothetical protein BGX26_009026 [Mortierella sp. AD094]|nr:hypothetical protein BGX26_009026 [Mortierella sp. AD094]
MPSNRQQSPGNGPESTTQGHARHQYSSAVATPQRQPQPQQPSDQRDPTVNGHQSTGSETGGFFMKPLTRPPDYRFNLYVKGLAPTMTTRGLFDLFKPYGNILACKIILDTESGFCRGGFVLFDNQESCSEARRGLTQQGLYVAVAHESASIKNLPPVESPSPEIKPVIPEFDNSNDFPSLPSKPVTKKAQNKKSQASSSTTQSRPTSNQADSNQSAISAVGTQVGESASSTAAPAPVPAPIPTPDPNLVQTLPHKSNEASSSNNQDYNSAFILGQPFLDFDGGFIGSHQQFLSENFSSSNGFEWFPSVPDQKPYLGVDDIDRYMNMLELNAAVATPQASGNRDGVRQPIHPNGAHISNTTIDDFMLEDRPRRESTLHFENLPDGLKYQELFELCAQYGSLVLTSVDIRYINEDCFGQGRVTFESHKDSEAALLSLLEKNYDVRHGDSGDMYPSEPAIDDHLYDQYFQQHQDFLRSKDAAPYETPDEMLTSIYQPGFFSTTPGTTPFTPVSGDSEEREHFWMTPIPDQPFQSDPSTRGELNAMMDADAENLSNKHEKLSMLGISPQSISPSLASSSASSLQPPHEWVEPPLKTSRRMSSDQSLRQYQTTQSSTSSESEESNDSAYLGSSKLLSYSDIVKVPAKAPVQSSQSREDALQDLKKRGNTNKSLDEKEYRLNLFLKNLEPTMNEFKLYEICVDVDLAIEGLKKLGYHAEVAVQSATNKLRCKTLSDMLFIQNIPPHVKENKILRQAKAEVMRDTKVAERFIEEYHGRVLGRDWKLPLQVSPAK